MEFAKIATTWKKARIELAKNRIALIEAAHDLKGAEADAWAQEGGIPGKNEAARRAALFLITYPEIETVNKLKAEIIMVEVEVDYRKALMYNAIRNGHGASPMGSIEMIIDEVAE